MQIIRICSFIFALYFFCFTSLYTSTEHIDHETKEDYLALDVRITIIDDPNKIILISLHTDKEIYVEENWRDYFTEQTKKSRKNVDYGTITINFISKWSIPKKMVANFFENIALIASQIELEKIVFSNIRFSKNTSILTTLLTQKKLLATPIIVSDKFGNTMLHSLFYRRDLIAIQKVADPLLQNRKVLTEQNKFGDIPIHILFQEYKKKDKRNILAIFDLFLDYANRYLTFIINDQNEKKDNNSVLHFICKYYHPSFIKKLLACNEVDDDTRKKNYIKHLSNPKKYSALIFKRKIDITRKNNYGWNPFSELLWRIFQDPKILRQQKNTKKYEGCIKMFIEQHEYLKTEKAQDESVKNPEQLLFFGKKQNTVYHICAKYGLLDLLHALLYTRTGVDINVQNKQGDTPFGLAMKHKQWKLIDTFWIMGSSAEIENEKEKTPIDLFFQKLQKTNDKDEYFSLREQLTNFLLYGIEPRFFKDLEGNGLLHFACRRNDPELIETLLNYTIRLKLQNNNGETAFHILLSNRLLTSGKKIKYDDRARKLLMPLLAKKRSLLGIKDNDGITIWDLIQSNDQYVRDWNEALNQYKQAKEGEKNEEAEEDSLVIEKL
jgi:ankyrin repeat protein